jgi:hypothetical protein
LKTLVGLTFFLGLLASDAFAADVSIKGSASQTLEASDNYFLVNTPAGPTIKSTTAGTIDILAQTATTNYLFDANYSYYKYFGRGVDDTSMTWGTPGGATFSIDHTEHLTKYNFVAGWNRVDAATTLLAQTGAASGRGSINTYYITGGATRDLSRIDTISWTTQASKVAFTDPAQFPYIDVITTTAWKHDVSTTTSLNNLVSLDWFSEDDPAQSQRLFWKIMTGFTSKLSQRLNFVGNIGYGFVNSYQTGPQQSVVPLSPFDTASFQPQAGAASSFLADVALSYQLVRATRITLTAAHGIFPTAFGQLQKTETVGLGLTHDINQRSNLSFATQFSFIPASQGGSAFAGQTGSSDFFSASANYGLSLTREWRTNVSYTYRQRNDDSGTGKSSTILFALSRDFTILGNPTAINLAERERARERAQQSVGQVFPNFQ